MEPGGIRQPSPARAPGGLAVRLLLLAVSLLVTLGLLELMLAAAGYTRGPVDIRVGPGADARAIHVFEDEHFEYDPVLIWRPRPSQSVFNSQGFRGPELDPDKPPGAVRIFTVGDSNTLGWAGPDGPNWPQDLQELLHANAAPGDDVTVVNAGVWGYASYQGLQRFRQTLAFDPDVVLVSFGSNDAHQVLRSDRSYAAAPTRETPAGRLLRRFRLGELLLAAVDRFSSGPAPRGESRVSPEDYRANLGQIIAEARQRDVEVVLLTRPYVGAISHPLWWKNWGADYNVATADVAERHGVPLVDVYSFFKGRDELFEDESHFTREGHRLAAAVILDHVEPIVRRRAARALTTPRASATSSSSPVPQTSRRPR